MTAIALPLASPHHSHARRRRLSLTTTDDSDLLLRVLTVVRRRGFDVLAVDYQAGNLHRPTVFSLTVESSSRTASRLDAWLANVVGVLAVEEVG